MLLQQLIDFGARAKWLLAGWVMLGSLAYAQSGYFHTTGNQILDSSNNAFRIAGVNWYGFETTDEVAHGLWAQDYHTILNAIKNNGYNVIRIPLSNQMVETPIVPSNINFGNGKNADLAGLNSLQVLDKIVSAAGTLGLRVILDNHRSEAGNSAEASGLWYTSTYPESSWIHDWTSLATRYLNNPTVIGMDLRNEPHSAVCWGCGSTTSDWRLAAERGGNAVLAVNPNLLIFVEGIDCVNGDCDWWGGNLENAQNYPVALNVSGRLVYSAHEYGPNLYVQNWFNSGTTQATLASVWTKYWAYLSLNNIAPVWVGEFGTTNNASDIQNTAPGSQGQWFSTLVAFFSSHPALQWTYWALNGEDSYALLDSNYDPSPVSATKQQMLASIQGTIGAPGGGGTTCTALAPTPTGLSAAAASSTQINLEWTGVTPPANCAVSYNVYASATSGFTPSSSNRIASGVSSASYDAGGLNASTPYYFIVTSVDAEGESTGSMAAAATTLAPSCTVAPPPPSGVTATANSSSQISLNWNGVSAASGCTVSYNVYGSTVSGFTPSSSNKLAKATGTSDTVTGLPASTTEYFVVRSADAAGNPATPIRPSPPPAPHLPGRHPAMSLIWSTVSGPAALTSASTSKTPERPPSKDGPSPGPGRPHNSWPARGTRWGVNRART